MKDRVCKHQRTCFETGHKVFLSTCLNRRSDVYCGPISHLTCDTCRDKEEPELEDFRVMETMPEVFEQPELPERTSEEQERILQTYCFKCKHYSVESKLCDSCSCGLHIPIDEFVKFKPHHCFLELW